MKIAYIVPYVPNGIRIRSYKLIEYLAKLGIEVSLFTISSNERDLEDVNSIKHICRDVYFQDQPVWRSWLNCLVVLPSTKSLQSVYSWNPRLGAALKKQIEANDAERGYDLIHVEHLRGSEYADYVRRNFPDKPLVWDSVDCISHLFKQAINQSKGLFGRFVSQLDIKRTQLTEGKRICEVDHVLVTSPLDRDALLALAPSGGIPAPISLITNGVDLDYYRQPDQFTKETNTIVFSGKMSYHANVTMATFLIYEIMPKVWQTKPDVRVAIVGKDPSPIIRKFSEDPRITVTGTVDDIRPFLWRAGVSVVPLIYGAGIQNKILEAMAAGTPVVASSRSLSALHVVVGRDLLIADSPEEFALQILQLMTNPKLYEDISRSGSEYVARYHDWRNIAKRLVGIYEQTIQMKNLTKNKEKML